MTPSPPRAGRPSLSVRLTLAAAVGVVTTGFWYVLWAVPSGLALLFSRIFASRPAAGLSIGKYCQAALGLSALLFMSAILFSWGRARLIGILWLAVTVGMVILCAALFQIEPTWIAPTAIAVAAITYAATIALMRRYRQHERQA